MEPHLTAAQQYFPTYKLDPLRSEIGLREYDLAAKALEADHKSLTAASGIALFFAGTAATLIGAGNAIQSIERLSIILGSSLEITLSLIIIFIATLAVHYFACLQRSATYAGRKIIILRRLLGLDYGNIETVLPSDRLDGANEPFSLPMFPGWLSLQALPVIAVAALSAFAQGAAFAAFHTIRPRQMTFLGGNVLASPGEVGWLIAGVTASLLLAFYRYSLFEDFETIRLRLAKILSGIIGSPIKSRIGHVLYRMRLSVFEAERLKIDLESFHKILLFIEDKRYLKHNGNSFYSLSKALYRYVRYKKISGGSTIYQQLARSNFIINFGASARRKVMEWMLAPWLNSVFDKREGINVYLCSVRFAYGIIGLPAAIAYYYPNKSLGDPVSNAERFVLIERLSNVTGTYPAARVRLLVDQLVAAHLLADLDRSELSSIYFELGRAGKLDLRGQHPAL